MTDPYAVLGVSKDATDDQIKAAFRKLAMKHHPDQNPGNAEAEAKFKEINAAYETLKSPAKKAAHDQGPQEFQFRTGNRGFNGGQFGFNVDEILREFERQRSQQNRHYNATCSITLMDAFRGCEVNMNLGEKEIRVKIPPGVDNGTRIRVAGGGENIHENSPPGDLFVAITVAPEPHLFREGRNLFSEVTVDAIDAMIGTTVRVNTIDALVDMKIEPGLASGARLRIAEHGMPPVGQGARGDHIVIVNIKLPDKLNEKQIDLLRQVKSLTA